MQDNDEDEQLLMLESYNTDMPDKRRRTDKQDGKSSKDTGVTEGRRPELKSMDDKFWRDL